IGSPAIASVRRGAGPLADTRTMPCRRTNAIAASAFMSAWPGSARQSCARQLADRSQSSLCGIQPQAKVGVGVGGIDIRGLMPLRVPTGTDFTAALVFAQADCRHEIHEGRAI